MGGQITVEGRKRPSNTVRQLLTPRSKVSTPLVRLSAAPLSPGTTSLPSSHSTVQRINVRLHKLSKYRLRPKKAQESPEFQPFSSTERPLSVLESESDDLTALPSSRTEQRTYKLLRHSLRSFEEGSGSVRLVEAPTSARRDSLAAAVQLTRAPHLHRTSILSLAPLRIPGPQDQPSLTKSWGRLVERRHK